MSIVVPRGPAQSTSAVHGFQAQAAPQAAVPTPVEAAPPAPVENASDEQLSPKFAALARQTKLLRRQQQEHKAREDALKAKEAEYQTNYVPKSRFKEDTFAALTDVGLSYDDVVNAHLSQDPVSLAMKPLEKKLTALEDAQKNAAKAAEENQKKQYEQAVTQVRNKVVMLVDADTTYKAIKANDAQEAVVELITETFKTEGKLLSEEEGCAQVEKFLRDSFEKIKQQLEPKPAETPVVPKQGFAAQIQKQQTTPKTLTNAATAVPSKPLSAKEKRERAIMAFRGQLT